MRKSIYTVLIVIVNYHFCLLAANLDASPHHKSSFSSDTSKLMGSVKIIRNSDRAIKAQLNNIDSLIKGNEDLSYSDLKQVFDSLCRIESELVYKYVLNNIDLNRVNISGTDIFGYDNYVVLKAIFDTMHQYDKKIVYNYFDFLLRSDILENPIIDEILELYAKLYLPSKYGVFDVIHFTHGSEIKAANLQRIKDIVYKK